MTKKGDPIRDSLDERINKEGNVLGVVKDLTSKDDASNDVFQMQLVGDGCQIKEMKLKSQSSFKTKSPKNKLNIADKLIAQHKAMLQ